MEHFEISKSDENRDKDLNVVKEYLNSNGEEGYPDSIRIIKKRRLHFGIYNRFPKLSREDDEERDKLFQQRDLQIKKYKRVCGELKAIMFLEKQIWYRIEEINKRICELEGHRLSEEIEEEYIDDGLPMPVAHYRTCLVCGKKIYKEGLTNNDVVVKEESGPERVLRMEKEIL